MGVTEWSVRKLRGGPGAAEKETVIGSFLDGLSFARGTLLYR